MVDGTEIGRALRACRSTAAFLICVSAAINLLSLAAPLYVMQLYDRVLASRSIDTLIMLTLAVIFSLIVLSVLDGLRNQILARIGIWLNLRLSAPVIAARLRLSGPALSQGGSQPLRDLAAIAGFLSSPGVTPLMDIPWTPLFVLMLFILHPVLGVFGAASALALLALAVVNEMATGAALRASGVAAIRSNAFIDAAFRSADTIRIMGMLDGVLRLWRAEADRAQRLQLSGTQRAATVLAVSKFTRLVVQSAIMGLAAWLVIDDHASPGTLFGSTFFLARALAPVESSIATWRSLVGARAAYRRLVELLRAAPAPREGMSLPRPKGVVTIEQLTYAPPNTNKPILRGVTLRFGPGEIIGIAGPSAAGKSTLARLIAGALQPSTGQVRLDGAEIGLWLASGGHRYLGYLPQEADLFGGSVRDNIARLGTADAEEVIAAATLAGLHEMIMTLPQGYDTEIGEAGVRLSGGQRQRIALARALFGDPRLVVLDEPDAGLDHEGELALVAALAALKEKGTTIVLVSHRPSILSHADKLAVMRRGVVELFGPREEVLGRLRPTLVQPPRQVAARVATSA